MRIVEGAIFLSLATGLHMGIWAASPAPDGAAPAGDGGQSSVTITPASAGMAQMVQRWQTAPLAQVEMASPVAPQVTEAALPAPAPASDVPQMAVPDRPALPEAASAPEVQETPPAAPVSPPVTALAQPRTPEATPRAELRPQARPAAPTAPRLPQPDVAQAPRADTQPATPQPAARAQGKPAQKPAASGAQGREQAAAAQAAQNATLQAQWGARIQSKIHRNLFYPRGASGSGTARVALTVDRSGRLQSVQLIRSSGVAAFDQAALRAVQRAGRFAKAPHGLGEASYRFTMGLNFKP